MNNKKWYEVDYLSILQLIFCLLLLVMFFRALGDFQPISFTSFLTWLRDFHPLLSNVSFTDLTIVGSWGIFDFLRDFINLFMQALSLLVFIAKSLINFISYILGFIKFLFMF